MRGRERLIEEGKKNQVAFDIPLEGCRETFESLANICQNVEEDVNVCT